MRRQAECAAAKVFSLGPSDAALCQQTKRSIPFLYVRGDGVILISPPLRT